jgi:peptide/nickel transport system substrate-binding protein
LSRPDVGYISPGAVSITVLDDFTLTYTSAVQDPLSDYRTFYPKHLLENLDPTEFYEWEFWTRPVGNGPYRFVRHVPQTMMELEANPDYFRGKPGIERVILKFGPTSLAELLSGNVDVLPQVNPMELPKLGEDPRFRIYYSLKEGDIATIYWNHRHPIFRDPRVRRALTLAINRRELLGVLNLPDDLPLFDVIYTERQRGELPQPLPFDPERAKQLLEEAGWHDVDGDGIRERHGEEFRFIMLVVGSRVREAVYIQDQLRRVGVRMEISTRESFSLVARELRAGDFEAAISRLFMVPGTARGPFAFFGEGSIIGYRNARVVELLEATEETQDPEKLDALYRELWSFFQADLPVTFLYPMTWTYVVHRRVRGLSTPWRADPVWHMEHLWLEDER